jgi:hypothetical protein
VSRSLSRETSLWDKSRTCVAAGTMFAANMSYVDNPNKFCLPQCLCRIFQGTSFMWLACEELVSVCS